ncbi:hypothetical protein Naga_100172g5 [Nannochloropsis gaditana]|uniref:Uncharacterized protein n=1 Tax=Nannochloropsis gaditana TaxID=72520 RepID=W7TAY1_9STRA|nr:hypothetical protein Naga_100172g5 [Nannochloropsis gaditana]
MLRRRHFQKVAGPWRGSTLLKPFLAIAALGILCWIRARTAQHLEASSFTPTAQKGGPLVSGQDFRPLELTPFTGKPWRSEQVHSLHEFFGPRALLISLHIPSGNRPIDTRSCPSGVHVVWCLRDPQGQSGGWSGTFRNGSFSRMTHGFPYAQGTDKDRMMCVILSCPDHRCWTDGCGLTRKTRSMSWYAWKRRRGRVQGRECQGAKKTGGSWFLSRKSMAIKVSVWRPSVALWSQAKTPSWRLNESFSRRQVSNHQHGFL